HGTSPARARPTARAWKKTSAPRPSGSRPTTSATSTAPPHGSRFRARATPNTWRNGRASDMRIGIRRLDGGWRRVMHVDEPAKGLLEFQAVLRTVEPGAVPGVLCRDHRIPGLAQASLPPPLPALM